MRTRAGPWRYTRVSPTNSIAGDTLTSVHSIASNALLGAPSGQFRILGGHKFLEIGPALAHKGRTIEFLTEGDTRPDALLVYIGDDDKDEEAFAVIQAKAGLTVVVAPKDRLSLADCQLTAPAAVRHLLQQLADLRGSRLGGLTT